MTADPRPEVDATSRENEAASWIDEHGDALFRYARARLGRREPAEDFVQETFLAALTAHDRFAGRSSARTWLMSILRRKIADHYRRGDGARPSQEPNSAPVRFFDEAGVWLRAPGRWSDPTRAIEDAEFQAVLNDCLEKLPQPLADAFLLREREGMEVEQVREALALSAGNLRVRLHRARLLLRECLEKHWFSDPTDPPTASREP